MSLSTLCEWVRTAHTHRKHSHTHNEWRKMKPKPYFLHSWTSPETYFPDDPGASFLNALKAVFPYSFLQAHNNHSSPDFFCRKAFACFLMATEISTQRSSVRENGQNRLEELLAVCHCYDKSLCCVCLGAVCHPQKEPFLWNNLSLNLFVGWRVVDKRRFFRPFYPTRQGILGFPEPIAP